MKRRVQFAHWGNSSDLRIPAYAVAATDEDDLDAVTRAVAAANRLSVCCCSPQGSALCDDGTVESRHYEVTLGRPVPGRHGGGTSVEGSVWIAIPVAQVEVAS